jgi:hypothetical protein
LGGPGLGPHPGAGRINPSAPPGSRCWGIASFLPIGIDLKLAGLCHLQLDPLQSLAAQAALQGAHLALAECCGL